MDEDENTVETINTGDYTPLKTEDDNIQNTRGINIVNLLYNQSKKIKGAWSICNSVFLLGLWNHLKALVI